MTIRQRRSQISSRLSSCTVAKTARRQVLTSVAGTTAGSPRRSAARASRASARRRARSVRRAARRSAPAGPRRPARSRCRAPSSRRPARPCRWCTGPVWMTPSCGSVAGEDRVLPDHRAVADAEQVSAHGHRAGQDDGAAPDFRAQRPAGRASRAVNRRTGPSGSLDQGLDEPEPEVRRAPDPDLLRLPPADQHPLEQDRQGAQGEEGRAAEGDRPQVDVDQVRAGRDPLVALHTRRHGEGGVAEEEQELQRPAEDVLTAAGPASAARWSGRSRRLRVDAGLAAGVRVGGEGCGEAADGGVLVDVLHRHRGQVGALAHPGAEAGHQHRVGAEVVEEVGCRPTRARCPRCRPAPPRRPARTRSGWSRGQRSAVATSGARAVARLRMVGCW